MQVSWTDKRQFFSTNLIMVYNLIWTIIWSLDCLIILKSHNKRCCKLWQQGTNFQYYTNIKLYQFGTAWRHKFYYWHVSSLIYRFFAKTPLRHKSHRHFATDMKTPTIAPDMDNIALHMDLTAFYPNIEILNQIEDAIAVDSWNILSVNDQGNGDTYLDSKFSSMIEKQHKKMSNQ